MRFQSQPQSVRLIRVLVVSAVLGLAVSPATWAQEAEDQGTVLLEAWLDNFDRASSKLVALAEEIPAEDYAWRPAPSVRSVAEVYTHVMGTNLFLAGALGMEPPEEMPASLSSIDQKNEVLRYLRLSLDHARKAVQQTEGKDLGRTVTLGRNRKVTVGEVMLLTTGHAHEHLGQLIAYARSRDVTPPWSRGGDDG